MDFGWTQAQRERYEQTFKAVKDAFPARSRYAFTRKSWSVLGTLGLLGASMPARYGGEGLSALDTARLFEAAGRGCPDTGLVFAAAAHLFACVMPLVEFGSADQRERLLPALGSGELIAGNAMTEAGAGSDIGGLATTAVADGDGFVLDGTKTFVSNGPVADVLITYAVTDPTAGHLGTSAFVVDVGTPGVKVGETLDKLGMEGCPAAEVSFTQCRVPRDALLGRAGQGGLVFQNSMGWERACLFALYLGMQDRLIDQCVAHVHERRQFGRRLSDFQSVSNRIVEMKLRVESARLLLYRACWAMDTDEPSVLYTALSKLATSQAAVASAADAVQLFGGRGYLREHGIEAALRDAVGGTIFSGTTDIQRVMIANELGL